MRERLLCGLGVIFCCAIHVQGVDLSPASFRNLPGSTYSQWSYDTNVVDTSHADSRYDVPDTSWFVSGPAGFTDPLLEYAEGFDPAPAQATHFSSQLFSVLSWPTPSNYADVWIGRFGVLTDVSAGSWDLNNIITQHLNSQTFVHMQVTWRPMVSNDLPDTFWIELDYETSDPSYNGPTHEDLYLDPFGSITTEIDYNWYQTVLDFEFNPGMDFQAITLASLKNSSLTQMAVDNVIIETYTIPEPVTLSLLSLGGIAVLRRKCCS